jgi:hypothetical protein
MKYNNKKIDKLKIRVNCGVKEGKRQNSKKENN